MCKGCDGRARVNPPRSARRLQESPFPIRRGRLGAPHLVIDGLDVIEGNEGGHRPLICEA